MKKSLIMTALIAGSIILFNNVYAANEITTTIQLQQAKDIYNAMTGPEVQHDGAAGHLYRIGKSITCRYTNVEMDDKPGHTIAMEDPRHYFCFVKFNQNGLASPGT
jgi:hypothetical protein